MWSNFEFLPPQFLCQAPPGAQQLSLPLLLRRAHREHTVRRAIRTIPKFASRSDWSDGSDGSDDDGKVPFVKDTKGQLLLHNGYCLTCACIHIMWELTVARFPSFCPSETIIRVFWTCVLPSTTGSATTELAFRVSRTLRTHKTTYCDRRFFVRIGFKVLKSIHKNIKHLNMHTNLTMRKARILRARCDQILIRNSGAMSHQERNNWVCHSFH